jgi:hypothetical protein
MRNKSYLLTVGEHEGVKVDAEAEGECRYMVRMTMNGNRLRIGYLTGGNNRWVAEFFHDEKRMVAFAVAYTSAKAACLAMAESALPTFNGVEVRS